LTPELEHSEYKMNLEHFVVPESKEELKNVGDMSKYVQI
jgi:hypothetical protein